jgi:putative glycosyltransferase (TIGR04348 family)
MLRELGHGVRILDRWRGETCDLLVALHARKSASSVRAFRKDHPRAAVVVALTGTDVYAPSGFDLRARSSLKKADRIVVLQREALRRLDAEVRAKTRVILQSATRPHRAPSRPDADFRVIALGHLRTVKDPLLAAKAARLLPADSRVRIEHYGSALDANLADRALRESRNNPRWKWRGEATHSRVLRILAGSDAFVQTSTAEGGSSAMSEAIVTGLPILSTRIPGAIGMLGERHEGYFEPKDARGLARLLDRCERDGRFRRALRAASRRRAPLFTPRRELRAWRSLLRELGSE